MKRPSNGIHQDHLQAAAFVNDKRDDDESGRHHVRGKELADVVRVDRVEEQGQVESVFAEPGEEVEVRDEYADKSQREVDALGFHPDSVSRLGRGSDARVAKWCLIGPGGLHPKWASGSMRWDGR